jgi:hypothetical protein
MHPMQESDQFKSYLFEYGHDGARWGFEVLAISREDAEERLSKLQFATYKGEVQEKLSAGSKPWASVLCWWKNLRARA